MREVNRVVKVLLVKEDSVVTVPSPRRRSGGETPVIAGPIVPYMYCLECNVILLQYECIVYQEGMRTIWAGLET